MVLIEGISQAASDVGKQLKNQSKGGKGGGSSTPSASTPASSTSAAPSYSATPSYTAPSWTPPAEPETQYAANADILAEIAARIAAATTSAVADVQGFDMNSVATAQDQVNKAQRRHDQALPEDQGAQTANLVQRYLDLHSSEQRPVQNTALSAWQQSGMTQQERSEAVSSPSPSRALAAAREDLQTAERRQRVEALGGVKFTRKERKAGEVEPMTLEAYNDLDPQARAAVDFNTMLVRSVRRDRSMADTYRPSPEQRELYDEAVENMFGDDGGSNRYAPETLAVLRQIRFKDETSDLDDFLDLRAAITKRDLRRMDQFSDLQGPAATDGTLNPVQFDRYQLTDRLATSTQAMQETLIKGNEMLVNINKTAMADRRRDPILQGTEWNPKLPLGYRPGSFENGAPQDLNAYFQTAFHELSRRDVDPQSILPRVQEDLSAEEYQQFLTYAGERSGEADRWDLKLGDTPGVKFRTPEQFRQELGLTEREQPAPSANPPAQARRPEGGESYARR